MEKILTNKKIFIGGALLLAIASLFAKILGAIYRIPLSNILGAEGIGVYQLAFPLYSFLLVFVSGGLPLAMSKIIAEYRAENKFGSITKLFRTTVYLTMILGIILACFFMIFGSPIALLQGNDNATMGYNALALAVIFSCIISAFRGIFQGYENMVPSAYSMLVEQVTKLGLGLFFAIKLIDKGIEYAVFGALMGVAIGEIFAFFLLLIWLYNKKEKYIKHYRTNKPQLAKLLKLSIPLSLSAVILPFSALVDSFLIVNLMKKYYTSSFATSLYGIQTGMIAPIINFPLVITGAFCTALLPTLCFLLKKNQTEEFDKTVKSVFKFVWSFLIPCSLGLIILSPNILKICYPNVIANQLFPTSVLMFVISGISIVFSGIASTAATVLQAKNKAYIPVKNLGIAVLVKIALSIILISNQKINIIGLSFANTICFSLYCVLNLFELRKEQIALISFSDLSLAFTSGIVMSIFVYMCNQLFAGSLILGTLISIFIGVFTYIISILLFKVYSISDAKRLFLKSQ